MNNKWQIENEKLREREIALIQVKGLIREAERSASIFSKLKILLLNNKKQKLEEEIREIKSNLKGLHNIKFIVN